MSRQSYLPLSIVRAFGLRFGSAYLLLRLSALECLTSLADGLTYYAPAPRSGGLSAPSVALGTTRSRSPGVSSIAFGAQPPDLRFAPLMDMDFATSCPLVRRWRLVSGSCSSARTFDPRFLQTPPRGDSPCASLTLHLHQVG